MSHSSCLRSIIALILGLAVNVNSSAADVDPGSGTNTVHGKQQAARYFRNEAEAHLTAEEDAKKAAQLHREQKWDAHGNGLTRMGAAASAGMSLMDKVRNPIARGVIAGGTAVGAVAGYGTAMPRILREGGEQRAAQARAEQQAREADKQLQIAKTLDKAASRQAKKEARAKEKARNKTSTSTSNIDFSKDRPSREFSGGTDERIRSPRERDFDGTYHERVAA